MKKCALLIGINQYHLLGNLSYARQDAEAIAEALCQYFGFTKQDIRLMTCQSEGASLGLSRYIELALMNLTDEKDVDLLVFGFWGHGFAPVSARRYLCGIDTSESDLERTGVSMDLVKAKLSQVQAENTLVFLDCCQNQPTGRSTSAEPMTKGEETILASMARDIQAASKKQAHDPIPTVAILNACREGQKAYEWNQRGHGIFTAHLLDAFEQGFTSIASLSPWLCDHVSKTSRDLYQQPQIPYIKIEGKGDILLDKPHEIVTDTHIEEFSSKSVPLFGTPPSVENSDTFRKSFPLSWNEWIQKNHHWYSDVPIWFLIYFFTYMIGAFIILFSYGDPLGDLSVDSMKEDFPIAYLGGFVFLLIPGFLLIMIRRSYKKEYCFYLSEFYLDQGDLRSAVREIANIKNQSNNKRYRYLINSLILQASEDGDEATKNILKNL